MPLRRARLRLHQLLWTCLAAVTLLYPWLATAHSPETSAHRRLPSITMPIVRLGVEGRVRVITCDARYLDAAAQVSLRGRTIGASNGRSRPPCQSIGTRRDDTLAVTYAPRPSVRAVGPSRVCELLDHDLLLSAGSDLLIEGNPREVGIDSTHIPRLKNGRARWTRLTGAVCHVTVAGRRAKENEVRVYEGMLRLGTGAGEYPRRRAPKDRTVANAR